MNNWISVDEKLPLLCESVLCCNADGGKFIAELHTYFGELDWYCYDIKMRNVTHWMPLPDGPYVSDCKECTL